MSKQRITELMQQLQAELKNTDIDDETLGLARSLENDLERLIESDEDQDSLIEPAIETARDAQARFAVEHPLAEKVLRELVDILGRMGV